MLLLSMLAPARLQPGPRARRRGGQQQICAISLQPRAGLPVLVVVVVAPPSLNPTTTTTQCSASTRAVTRLSPDPAQCSTHSYSDSAPAAPARNKEAPSRSSAQRGGGCGVISAHSVRRQPQFCNFEQLQSSRRLGHGAAGWAGLGWAGLGWAGHKAGGHRRGNRVGAPWVIIKWIDRQRYSATP